ncbi:MAG: hypothetical protein ACTS6G_02630 [Candidatus Hodgkinia cicadicola]
MKVRSLEVGNLIKVYIESAGGINEDVVIFRRKMILNEPRRYGRQFVRNGRRSLSRKHWTEVLIRLGDIWSKELIN